MTDPDVGTTFVNVHRDEIVNLRCISTAVLSRRSGPDGSYGDGVGTPGPGRVLTCVFVVCGTSTGVHSTREGGSRLSVAEAAVTNSHHPVAAVITSWRLARCATVTASPRAARP